MYLFYFSVLSYLIMFRLEELGMNNFKKLVNSQHTGKMYKVHVYVYIYDVQHNELKVNGSC